MSCIDLEIKYYVGEIEDPTMWSIENLKAIKKLELSS